jgi:uncharacterized membrane protein
LCAYLVPLGCLPVLSLQWAVPAFVIMFSGMISTNPGQHEQLLQYPPAAIPFLFMAFMYALPRLKRSCICRLSYKTNFRAYQGVFRYFTYNNSF